MKNVAETLLAVRGRRSVHSHVVLVAVLRRYGYYRVDRYAEYAKDCILEAARECK